MKRLLLSTILSITFAFQIFAAGTFTVTTTNDNGVGSLRVAMQNAIASGSGTITIQASGTITLASALPVITAPITIICTNTSGITVSGNNAYRVFEVQLATGTVTFKNLNIINGVGAGGGGIFAITSNNGKVALENCTISGCNASGSQAYGGAICSSADVDLLNCTITGNNAADGGGAIEMIDGTGASTLTINHSTITQNSTATNDIAGGIDVYLNKIIISNSIVGNNTNGNAGTARDISLDVSNSNTQVSSYNLYTTAPFSTPGTGDLPNKSVAELGLSVLADNGGGVKTQALTPASLARNNATGALITDARGIIRDSKPDRGAYEEEAAFDITLSASAINEYVAANSSVGTLSSMDNDAGDTFTYSLVGGTGDTDNASFNISGSSLRITNSPDFEAKNSCTVRVRTTDQDGFTYEKVFTITINDINEAPIDIALSASAINENVAANSTIGTLSTTDPDASNTFIYTLVSGTGDTDNASFNISGSSLRITNNPDFEAKNSYAIRVRTTDQGGLFFEKAFTITINDLLEAAISSITFPANGTYGLGQDLVFVTNFSKAVTVSSGIPYIAITVGGVSKQATYVSGSGTASLIFRYTLVSGDAGSLATGASITLNGAAIKDDAGNDAMLDFAALITSGVNANTLIPIISSITPASGLTTGGTSVTITGTNLLAASSVKFGSTNATDYTIHSATEITAISPAGSVGVVHITVTTLGGASAASSSDQFTYYTVPDAPVIGIATSGNAQASVSFTAPTFNGGSEMTGYTVTSSPGALTVTGTTSPITVTGLANGTAYTFTVTATNTAGTSAASGASNSVTPCTLPTVITDAATDITSSGATLNGTINANGGSTAVTFEYGTTTAYGTVAALQSPVSGVSATSVSKVLTDLISNTTYHYRVVGVNESGTTTGQDQTFATALRTGLDNTTATVLSLYPNPTSDGFYIQAGEAMTLLSISDLSGRIVFVQQVTGNSYINISSLQKGAYVVKVNGSVAKLVKK